MSLLSSAGKSFIFWLSKDRPTKAQPTIMEVQADLSLHWVHLSFQVFLIFGFIARPDFVILRRVNRKVGRDPKAKTPDHPQGPPASRTWLFSHMTHSGEMTRILSDVI